MSDPAEPTPESVGGTEQPEEAPLGHLPDLLRNFDDRLKALEAKAESALEPRVKRIEDWLSKL